MEKQVYELPSTFDEFVDARKAGFMKVKEYKENGGKFAGTLCSYTPNELLDAAGVAYTVSNGVYIVELDNVESLTFSLANQARFSSLTVTYIEE